MKTLVNAGNRVPYTNSGGSTITSGSVVVLVSGATGYIGIAVTDIAVSASGELCIGGWPEGVHTLTKHSGEAFTFGQLIYWDATNSRLTGTATGNTRAGRCTGVYASSATSANVKINQP